MNRHLRWFFALLILLTGSFAFLSGTGYANPGGFDVPEIQGDFEQFEHNAGTQREQPIHQTEVQAEEKGFWDKTTESLKEGWQWFKDKGSEFLDWTKEKASAFWEEIKSIISKITDVAVNALASFGNWIIEHKGIALVVLTIVGIVVAVVGFVVGAAIAVTAGVSILLGILVSGIFSWISGNELFGDEMLTDMLFGGIIGGISALFGFAAGTGAIASNVGRWLGTKIPWLGRAFPAMYGSSVAAGVDQSLWDLLKTGKINWKNTAIAALFAFTVSFGGGYASKYSDDIIKWINNREIPSFSQSLVMSGDSAALTAPTTTRIGDTRFGQWLQKFSAEGGGNHSTNAIASNKSQAAKNIITDGSHINPDGTLKPNVRYRSGEFGYVYETDDLGRVIEFNADEYRLTERTKRLKHKSNTPDKLPGDHAGHLAGDRFGGSPDLDNLVSQSKSVNLSSYKRLENIWAKAIKNGQHVSVKVKIHYEGNSFRPSRFDIDYIIDGVDYSAEISN